MKKSEVESSDVSFAGKEILTAAEARAFLGISTTFLNELVNNRELPCYRPRRRIRYCKREELIRWALSGRSDTEEEQGAAVASYVSAVPAWAGRGKGKGGRDYGI